MVIFSLSLIYKMILENLIILLLKIKLHIVMKLNCFSFLAFSIFLGLFSCNNKSTSHIENDKIDSLNEISNTNLLLDTSNISVLELIEKLNNNSDVQSDLKKYRPMYVIGDWAGIGQLDTLSEHYYSRLKGIEVISPLVYTSVIDYDSAVAITQYLRPISYMISNNSSIDTLFISDNQ